VDGSRASPVRRSARGVADVVSAPPGIGRRQRPRLHRASPCAGTRRGRLGLRRRGGAPAKAPPIVAALTAGHDDEIHPRRLPGHAAHARPPLEAGGHDIEDARASEMALPTHGWARPSEGAASPARDSCPSSDSTVVAPTGCGACASSAGVSLWAIDTLACMACQSSPSTAFAAVRHGALRAAGDSPGMRCPVRGVPSAGGDAASGRLRQN
jgi:hypothetical protein